MSAPTAPPASAPRAPISRPRAAGSAPVPSAPPAQHKAATQFQFIEQVDVRGRRIVFYAGGGWGKTSLTAMAPGAGIIDLEQRTGHVAEKLAQHNYPLRRISGLGIRAGEFDAATGYDDVRGVLGQRALWTPGSTAIIDSVTRLEEWAFAWVVKNRKKAKGQTATGIADFGYGDGYDYACEAMCLVLQDCDALIDRGVNVILIAHDFIANLEDPAQVGLMKRYEPRLYESNSGKSSIRRRVREWADAVLFGAYDMAKETGTGMVKGSGTRTIYTQERPGFLAKSSLGPEHFAVPVADEFDGGIWDLVIGKPVVK